MSGINCECPLLTRSNLIKEIKRTYLTVCISDNLPLVILGDTLLGQFVTPLGQSVTP